MHTCNADVLTRQNIRIFTDPHRVYFQRYTFLYDSLSSLFSLLFNTHEMLSGYFSMTSPLRWSLTYAFWTDTKKLCQELMPVFSVLIKYLVHYFLVSHPLIVWCKLGNTFYVKTWYLQYNFSPQSSIWIQSIFFRFFFFNFPKTYIHKTHPYVKYKN